jgi:hypothetical protein
VHVVDVESLALACARTAHSRYFTEMKAILETVFATKWKQALFKQADVTFRELHVRACTAHTVHALARTHRHKST